MKKFLPLLIFLLPFTVCGQDLFQLQAELEKIDRQRAAILDQIEDIKLAELRSRLRSIGLPRLERGEQLIEHKAMMLVYSEPHEQAKWVAHIITPDIITGQVTRSNDFRTDPLVTSGTAVEADYFLKSLQGDGTFAYDGFGYDRGHLAPSADFRWSERALSESYYYSNMSPQAADFNREGWGELENALRGYIYHHPETELYVVTGGLLTNNLPVIERGLNRIRIPEYFWKVALDPNNGRAIGFLMPNKKLDHPIEHYAVSIDKIEAATGIDLYANLPDELENKLESTSSPVDWFPNIAAGDVEPIPYNQLPRKAYNTVMAGKQMGSGAEITVCGKVVGARYSRAGNILINLDKNFPDQIFTVFIRKENIVNFSYDPVQELQGQVICVTGKIENLSGTPAIFAESEVVVEIAGDKK